MTTKIGFYLIQINEPAGYWRIVDNQTNRVKNYPLADGGMENYQKLMALKQLNAIACILIIEREMTTP